MAVGGYPLFFPWHGSADRGHDDVAAPML
jgi:hypothetical protein